MAIKLGIKDIAQQLLDENFSELGPAQAASDRAATTASFGRVGSNLASALSGGTYKPNDTVWADMERRGQQGVGQAMQRVALKKDAMNEAKTIQSDDLASQQRAEEEDPNSERSLQTQKFIAGAFPGLSETVKGMSHARLKEMTPIIEKLVPKPETDHWTQHDDSANGESTMINSRTAERRPVHGPVAGAGADRGANQKEKDRLSRLELFRKTMSETEGKARLLPQNRNRQEGVSRVLSGVLDEKGNVKDLSPQRVTDIAAGMASVIANGGQPPESLVHAITARGRGMNQAAIEEFLTNVPHGAGQQAYLRQIVDWAKQEDKTIAQNMREDRFKEIPGYRDVKRDSPQDFGNILKAAGIDADKDIDENFQERKRTPVKKQYSAARNQTRVTYSDGSVETVDGRQ